MIVDAIIIVIITTTTSIIAIVSFNPAITYGARGRQAVHGLQHPLQDQGGGVPADDGPAGGAGQRENITSCHIINS